jgi:peptidoglycan/LPS O-acetylase OafA/YrhL
MATPTIPHRPALDGVRALAVAGVLLYHGGVDGLPGGFLGVDLFFVLSGFLITSLLLTEYQATGGLDVADFWFRRARRLLPALVVVVLFVAAYAAWLAPDIVRARLRGDLLSTLAYVANWRFVVAGVSYFEQYSTPTPLLHTWSLAIEEQFYVLWPLLMLLLLRRRRSGAAARIVFVVAVLGALASALLMAAMYTPSLDPSRIYYGTDTRAQALLVGVAAAAVAVRRNWWQVGPRGGSAPRWVGLMGALSLAGVVALFVSATDSATWMYRGGFLVTALVSAGLVVAAASPGGHPVQRLLSVAPLRALGGVSYGVYLWHWPLYVLLTPDRTGLTGTGLLVLRLAVTGLAATLSAVLLERPIRAWRPQGGLRPGWSRRSGGWLAGAAALCVAATVAATGPQAATRHLSSDDLGADPVQSTSTGAPTAPTIKAFLLGDSVAYNLHTENRPDPSLGIVPSGLTRLGCNQFGGTLVIDGRQIPSIPECAEWPADWRRQLLVEQPDVAVMMPGNGELFDHDVAGKSYTFGTPAYRDALISWMDETLGDLHEVAPKVALTTVPCYDKPDTGLDQTSDIVNDDGRQDWLNRVIRDYVADHPHVHLLDLRSAVCPDGHYEEVVNGVRLRKDGVHWTAEGAAFVWQWYAEQLHEVAAAPD